MLSIVGLFCFAILPGFSQRGAVHFIALRKSRSTWMHRGCHCHRSSGSPRSVAGTSWRGQGCTDQGLPGIHLARSLVADFEASEETDAQVADTLVAGVQGCVTCMLVARSAESGPDFPGRQGEPVEPVEVELFWGYPRQRSLMLPVQAAQEQPVQPVHPATVAPWASATSATSRARHCFEN
ncbi:unnamed protein product [Cladocopium goreaui]|uniref:Secreted protein n=1 Tax=Cladocopium goreaui TaxID=2562237 RepID=A0A9P1CYI0_9DINO|nr:unnamed protein product [Cladocopium goreaui]